MGVLMMTHQDNIEFFNIIEVAVRKTLPENNFFCFMPRPLEESGRLMGGTSFLAGYKPGKRDVLSA